jgi:hypothetical protein
MRRGFLGAGVLLLVLADGCWDEEKPCKASTECAQGEICAGPSTSRTYYCMKDCTASGTCAEGTCAEVTSADCPTCDVITKACHVNRPLGY